MDDSGGARAPSATSHPVRHARAVLPHREGRHDPADDRQHDHHHPVPQLLIGAEQRRAHDVEVVQQRVELDDLGPAAGALLAQRLVVPDDRRHVEQQLHQAEQQRADVAVAGGQDAEAQCHPDAVQHDQRQRRDERQIGPLPGLRKDDRDHDEDDDVVPEQDHLSPHQPVDVHRQRSRKLFDQALVGDEHVGALEDRRVDQVPDDQAERDVRQVLGQFEVEQLGVQAAQAPRPWCRWRW